MSGVHAQLERLLMAARAHPVLGAHLADVERFEQVPVMDKRALHPLLARLERHPSTARGTYWSPTGGTSRGGKVYVPTDVFENMTQRQMLARYLGEAGVLTDETIALNLFSSQLLYRACVIFDDLCVANNGTSLPATCHAPDAEALEIASRFGANTVFGEPSRLVQLARYVGERGSPCRLEKLVFAGSPLLPRAEVLLREHLGVETVCALFGSAETGVWGVHTPALEAAGGVRGYHVPAGLVHIEILEPDQEGFGRLVVTNLTRQVHPILRYATGDRARVLTEEPDGRCVLEVAGRDRRSLLLGGFVFEAEDLLGALEHTVASQLVLTFDDVRQRDHLEVRVVARDATEPLDVLALRLTLAALTGHRDALFGLEVVEVSMEQLARSEHSGKVIPILDSRASHAS